MAAITIISEVGSAGSISLGKEPAFTPMRIGICLSFAASTTALILSGPPMLPGLRRSP